MRQSERRDSFRIDDKIYLYILNDGIEERRAVDEKIGAHLETLRELNQLSNPLLAEIRKSHPDIAQYLTLIDKKINSLTRIVSMDQAGGDIEPNMWVNISASGISFNSYTAYCQERVLSLRMVLFPACATIGCKARVVYSRAEREGVRVALQFIDLDVSERELLIRYMIEKQSEQLHRRERGEA